MFDEDLKKNILVVDDNITSLTTLRTILEGVFEVCLAKSPEIGMTILDTRRIDMILLDMEMPQVSGLDFLKVIRKTPAFYRIPVIIVSSHGTADTIIEAKKAGAQDFVVKPINPKALLEKVNATFKMTPRRISRDALLRQIAILESACKMGKSARVEEVVGVLEQVYYNIAVDRLLADICRYAKALDYNVAAEKAGSLLNMKLDSSPETGQAAE